MNNNPLTNQSYINKDFQTIYPELLELVKKLSYKWDPTVSNESDPGVILIKLNAILADKNNYNIDKNILECFPDTVTQHSNACRLFEQLGYSMHWYRAATGEVSLTWNSEPLTEAELGRVLSVKVPQFTMVSDEDKEIVYTLLDEVSLKTSGESVKVGAIQGVIRDLTIGSSTLIKSSMLDEHNRIYFPISNVAENGVFISDANRNLSTGEPKFEWHNPNTSTIEGWKLVDNLYVYPIDYKCYKFGVNDVDKTCYLEFPPNNANLMGEGIQIKYIQTDGGYGNIAAKRLSKFYTDVDNLIGDRTVSVSNNSSVANYSSITNGEEPETIDDAYINYKKTIGTFNTLVTLRDYLNYIVKDEFEQVSNGVVADRINDIQSSYEIVTTIDGTTTTENVVSQHDVTHTATDSAGNTIQYIESVPEMGAFDLKTYFLEYSKWPKFTTSSEVASQMKYFKEAYNKSFNFKLSGSTDPLETGSVQSYYKDAKRIEHDFISKLPNRPLLFKNKFKLNMTIIPNNMVSEAQAADIEKNVYESVLKNLSSNNISFGEEISFEQVHDICGSADTRIKAIALDSLDYTTYAVIYLEDAYECPYKAVDEKGISMELKDGLNEIPLPTQITSDDYDSLTLNERIALEVCAKNILKGTTPMYYAKNGFTYSLDQRGTTIFEDVERVTTSCEIEFKDNTGQYTYIGEDKTDSRIGENESLFLYAPYLKEEMTYSQSTKYIYYTTPDYTGYNIEYIPQNSDYILSRGQHLFIFWKEEDSKDAPYHYIRHGEGDVIFASTRVIKSESEHYGAICSKLEECGYEGEGQILGELNDKLYEVTDTILSTTKDIVLKKINSVVLAESSNYCYWITNNIAEDKDNDNILSYGLTFDYVKPDITNVEASYHSGLVYVANFDWSNDDGVSTTHKLESNETIYILEPKTYTTSYNALNNSSGENYVEERQVTDYFVRDILRTGDTIRSTGDIIRCPDIVLTKVFQYEKEDIISWGEFSDTITAERSIPAFEYQYVWPTALRAFDSKFAGRTYRATYVGDTSDKLGDKIQSWKLECSSHSGVYPWILSRIDSEVDFSDNEDIPDGRVGPCIQLWSLSNNATPLNPVISLHNYGKSIAYEFKIGDYLEFSMGPADISGRITLYTSEETHTDGYYIPVADNAAKTLEANPQYTLTNGYKIDVIGEGTTIDKNMGTSKFEYLLKANEQFIYTDMAKSGLYFHSNGTKITLEKFNKDIKQWSTDAEGNLIPDSFTLYVPTMDTTSIFTDQLGAFNEKMWHNFKCTCVLNPDRKVSSFDEGELITLTENQLIVLGEGTEVRIKLNPISVPTYVNKTIKKENKYLPQYKYLKIDSKGIYVSANGEPDSWTQMRDALSNYTVQYRTEEDKGTWVDLPTSSNPDIAWNGYMILSLKCGPQNPQRLSSKHNNTLTIFNKDFPASIGGATISPVGEDVYIQTSSYLNILGGTNIDVSGLTFDGDTVYPDLMYYTLSDENYKVKENEYSVVKDGDDMIITAQDGEHTIELGCSMPKNIDMMLPMEFLSDYDVTTFGVKCEVRIDEDEVEVRQATFKGYVEDSSIVTNDNKIKRGVYYCDVGGASALTVTYKGNGEITFRLKGLFPYSYDRVDNEYDKVVSEASLLKEINKWDINHKFDYTYQPHEDATIDDPLNPISYFNTGHRCNEFVISQISDIKLKTINKRS